MPITEARYLQLALEDDDGKWELVDGCPRKKPAMAWEHNHTARELAFLLNAQLNRAEWEVVHDSGRVRRNERNYFVPDVYVAPMEYIRRTFTRPGMLEVYREPLPLVVEVWSPSTSDYDVTDKLAEYRTRGDREIWLIHPYERTVAIWRHGVDGNYGETLLREGTFEPAFLPGVRIDFTDLFR